MVTNWISLSSSSVQCTSISGYAGGSIPVIIMFIIIIFLFIFIIS